MDIISWFIMASQEKLVLSSSPEDIHLQKRTTFETTEVQEQKLGKPNHLST